MSLNESIFLNLCDAKLQTEDGFTFDIHRIVLSRKSEYFCSMFYENKSRKEFTIQGVSRRCLTEILHYIYTDKIHVTEQNFPELLKATDFLLLKDINLLLKQSLNNFLTTVNCIEVFKSAYLINDEAIYKKSFRFIETKFQEIICTQMNDLAELPLELFKQIIESRSLRVYSETTVWLSILEWTKKDISTRLSGVPQLLTSLAGQELDEKLATNILQHDIVSQNKFMEDLKEYSQAFNSHLEVLLCFLEKNAKFFQNSSFYRIPSHLHVFASYLPNKGIFKHKLYITYDEHLDLWREIGEISNYGLERLRVVGQKLFLFEEFSRRCKQFDLLTQQWTPMLFLRNLYRNFRVLDIEGYVYVLGEFVRDRECHNFKFGMDIYDIENNRWLDTVLLSNICKGASVTIDKKICVVGNTDNLGRMTTRMFDPANRRWVLLSPPNKKRENFELIHYHGNVYMIGGETSEGQVATVEVLDAEANLWREVPCLPSSYDLLSAFVLNDQLFVYGYITEAKSDILRWNEAERFWERLEAKHLSRDMVMRHCFSTVNDVNAIRIITKQNRDPRTKLEKSPFSENAF